MKQTIEQLKRIVLDLKQYFEKSLPLILIGVALGYTFAQHLETQTKQVGFSCTTVERVPRQLIRRELLTMIGKGDTLDLVLTISIIALAIAMSMGIETLFDWYIKY